MKRREPWGGLRRLAMKNSPVFYLTYALQLAVVFCAYYFSAYWGLSLASVNTFAAPIWPPTGIALAAIYFGGFRLLPAIGVAAFIVNIVFGAPVIAAAGIGLGNSIEALLGVYLLRSLGFRPIFDRLRDSIGFIAVAVATPFVSAVIGPVMLGIAGTLRAADLPITSLTWWIGDVIGALIIGPFLLKWFARPIYMVRRSLAQWVENVAFFCALIFTCILVFWDPIPGIQDFTSPYLIFIPLTWGALRVGPRFMTIGVATVATLAISGTFMGLGPFSGSTGINEILYLQIFLATVAMISLLFTTTVEERKKATDSLKEHVVELEEDFEQISEDDKAKNEFIAILSHELRNPLAPVVSSLELLRLKVADGHEFKPLFNTMYEQVARMTRLLDDLLDMTRISRKKFTLQISRVRLQDVLMHSATTARDSIRKRNHTLTMNVPSDAIWVDADPLRLEQVFVNLLNNAAKYTNPGGTIMLLAMRLHNGVQVAIRDNGIGLPKDMLIAIFEPFRQVHAGESGTSGLGIGLSLSKRFIELHGGTIEAKSDGEGAGSEFVVWLPTVTDMLLTEARGRAAAAARPPPQPQAPAPPQHMWNLPKKSKRSILIVDDNEDAARAIAQLLNHSGHHARIAHDALSAFKELGEFRPDIIFLDIGLPGESGYDIARKLRHYLNPQPILVALTGYGQDDDKQRAIEAGFDFHLTKPVSIAELEKILAINA